MCVYLHDTKFVVHTVVHSLLHVHDTVSMHFHDHILRYTYILITSCVYLQFVV